MPCYPEKFLQTHEVEDEVFPDWIYPDARKRRDQRARMLRKAGWTVECHKVGFSDLARGDAYVLHAERLRLPTQHVLSWRIPEVKG